MARTSTPGLYYWLPVLIWLEFIFILSSIPGGLLPEMPSDWLLFWAHRIAHFIEYSVLGALVLRAWTGGRAKPKLSSILFLWIFIFFAGLFDEGHQFFVSGRHPDMLDAIFDTICGVWGMYFYLKWPKKC